MDKSYTDIDIAEVFSDIPTYTVLKQFGFNTIQDVLDVESLEFDELSLFTHLKLAFSKLVRLGYSFNKINIACVEDVCRFFDNWGVCCNCGCFCVNGDNTDFCSVCNVLNKLPSVNDMCFWYYSKEKKAIVVRNCSSKVFSFDMEIDDAYVIINDREENLVDDGCIFEFQSGIMPQSERVLIDLSAYEDSMIQSIVLVASDVYYEFTRKNNLLLTRVVNSNDPVEISYHKLCSAERSGAFCKCDVDVSPLIKRSFEVVQGSFKSAENQELANELRKTFVGCTLSQLGFGKLSRNTKIDDMTLGEILSCDYEYLRSLVSLEDLEELVLNRLKKFWESITILEAITDETLKAKLVLKNKLVVCGAQFNNIKNEDSIDILNGSIDNMGLSVRSYNCLKRAGLKYIHQLVLMDEDDFMGVRNLGRKSMLEVIAKLDSLGLSIRTKETLTTLVNKVKMYSEAENKKEFSREELVDVVGRSGVHSLLKWDVLEEEGDMLRLP